MRIEVHGNLKGEDIFFAAFVLILIVINIALIPVSNIYAEDIKQNDRENLQLCLSMKTDSGFNDCMEAKFGASFQSYFEIMNYDTKARTFNAENFAKEIVEDKNNNIRIVVLLITPIMSCLVSLLIHRELYY